MGYGGLGTSRSKRRMSRGGHGVRGRLQTVWYNLVVNVASTNVSWKSDDKTLWLLGVCYRDGGRGSSGPSTSVAAPAPVVDDGAGAGAGPSTSHDAGVAVVPKEVEASFRRDFRSRIWLSYRRNFSPISGSSLTSDCGWGCMIRAGQMLLAQCLALAILGRDWRLDDDEAKANNPSYLNYLKIIRWFNDEACDASPFSIHNVVETAVNVYGKRPGDWFGPCTMAGVLTRLINENFSAVPEIGQLKSIVAHDHTIYRSVVRDACLDPATGTWRPSVLFVPLRLGSHSINKKYMPALKALLTIPQCGGLIGGCGSSALYFVGFQGDCLIYIDPHGCKKYVGDAADGSLDPKSFQPRCPRKMKFVGLDPSMGVAFFCRDEATFEDLCARLNEMASIMELPILSVAERAPDTSGCLDDPRPSVCNGDDFVVL